MKQFEIWWADLPQPAGRRPVLLLSRDDAYSYLNKFIVAEITTTIRNIRVEVPLGSRDGMRRPSVVNCDNIWTVSRQSLSGRIAALAPDRHAAVKRAVGFAFGWAELTDRVD